MHWPGPRGFRKVEFGIASPAQQITLCFVFFTSVEATFNGALKSFLGPIFTKANHLGCCILPGFLSQALCVHSGLAG